MPTTPDTPADSQTVARVTRAVRNDPPGGRESITVMKRSAMGRSKDWMRSKGGSSSRGVRRPDILSWTREIRRPIPASGFFIQGPCMGHPYNGRISQDMRPGPLAYRALAGPQRRDEAEPARRGDGQTPRPVGVALEERQRPVDCISTGCLTGPLRSAYDRGGGKRGSLHGKYGYRTHPPRHRVPLPRAPVSSSSYVRRRIAPAHGSSAARIPRSGTIGWSP